MQKNDFKTYDSIKATSKLPNGRIGLFNGKIQCGMVNDWIIFLVYPERLF